MVVDEMDKITPRKIQFISSQPINLPAKYPRIIIENIWVKAVIEAVPPTLSSFLKLNSNPKLNNRNMTPISAQTVILFVSLTVGKK